ncbi:hypothetical protein ACFQNF_15675 [Iodobacter arcticus]|uniref:Uncharacterized protein n=1 Tax=Iodobacter arcticus TaxID=590593 RepID=A0ABW2R0X6_9NEIS
MAYGLLCINFPKWPAHHPLVCLPVIQQRRWIPDSLSSTVISRVSSTLCRTQCHGAFGDMGGFADQCAVQLHFAVINRGVATKVLPDLYADQHEIPSLRTIELAAAELASLKQASKKPRPACSSLRRSSRGDLSPMLLAVIKVQIIWASKTLKTQWKIS